MCSNPQETADLVIFTEENLNGKLHFLRSEILYEPPIFFRYFTGLLVSEEPNMREK